MILWLLDRVELGIFWLFEDVDLEEGFEFIPKPTAKPTINPINNKIPINDKLIINLKQKLSNNEK